jgi:hypothetical protein
MRYATLSVAAVLALGLGCAMRERPSGAGAPPFRFPADTFAFANETIWEYDIDAVSGHVSWRRRQPEPPFALRCGTMVRAARQFHFAARFDPTASVIGGSAYLQLVRQVLHSNPRRSMGERIVIPGYADLRSFSAAHEALLETALAGPWQSYLQRGNWRMIFPFSARHQRRLAQQLLASLGRGWPPIVHVLRYPQLTINHLVLVFDAEETPAEIRFRAYDPNEATEPLALTYDRAARGFSYAPTRYFPGGPVKIYEVYDGLLY